MAVPEVQVFYSSGINYLHLPLQYIISDFLAGILLLAGMLYLAPVMRTFLGGYLVRKYAIRPVGGILLYAIFHQGGELACESTLHGGFPTNAFGVAHIIFFQSIGGIAFLIGSFQFYVVMRNLLKGE